MILLCLSRFSALAAVAMAVPVPQKGGSATLTGSVAAELEATTSASAASLVAPALPFSSLSWSEPPTSTASYTTAYAATTSSSSSTKSVDGWTRFFRTLWQVLLWFAKIGLPILIVLAIAVSVNLASGCHHPCVC
jgi:Trk-type K+ transport system membrane component